MTFEDIKSNIKNDKYSPGVPNPAYKSKLPDTHVFDSTKSVDWNREQVRQHNQQYYAGIKAYRDAQRAAEKRLEDDISEMLAEDYGITLEAAHIVAQKAYDNAHAEGLYDILREARDIGEFVEAIIKANAKN